MTSFQWGIAIGGLTLTTVNIAWLSYQVRELWSRVIAHEQRLDVASGHRAALNTKVGQLEARLSNLETDGK